MYFGFKVLGGWTCYITYIIHLVHIHLKKTLLQKNIIIILFMHAIIWNKWLISLTKNKILHVWLGEIEFFNVGYMYGIGLNRQKLYIEFLNPSRKKPTRETFGDNGESSQPIVSPQC